MSLKGGNQTVTQNVDPRTQAYVDQMRRAALGYAGIPEQQNAPTRDYWGGKWMMGPGGAFQVGGRGSESNYQPIAPPPNPAIDAAQQQFGQYANAGELGLNALTGAGPNVFQNQYLSAMNPTFDFLRQQAVNQANDQATQNSAFGGSRGDIFAGTAVGDINRNQAALNYNAFNDSQQRALAAAQLGYGAQANSAFLPQQYAQGQLGILNAGLGPYGQTQTTHTSADPFSQLLGLGLMFAPGGQLAGLLKGGSSMAIPMVV